jgi:hypothetical protein
LKKPYLLPFTYPPDVREKKFLFSDAWAIAEAYVGLCVGFTYPPDPAVCLHTIQISPYKTTMVFVYKDSLDFWVLP